LGSQVGRYFFSPASPFERQVSLHLHHFVCHFTVCCRSGLSLQLGSPGFSSQRPSAAHAARSGGGVGPSQSVQDRGDDVGCNPSQVSPSLRMPLVESNRWADAFADTAFHDSNGRADGIADRICFSFLPCSLYRQSRTALIMYPALHVPLFAFRP
jgi:hypothetical protein